jgi:hypothetical protein
MDPVRAVAYYETLSVEYSVRGFCSPAAVLATCERLQKNNLRESRIETSMHAAWQTKSLGDSQKVEDGVPNIQLRKIFDEISLKIWFPFCKQRFII